MRRSESGVIGHGQSSRKQAVSARPGAVDDRGLRRSKQNSKGSGEVVAPGRCRRASSVHDPHLRAESYVTGAGRSPVAKSRFSGCSTTINPALRSP